MSCTPRQARTRTPREKTAPGAVALRAITAAAAILALGATALGGAASAVAAGNGRAANAQLAGGGGGHRRGHAGGGHAGRARSRTAGGHRGRTSGGQRQAPESDQLWATIDVCRMGAQPMIGVRGSMPPDGHLRDTMYMRFRLQYFDAAGESWRSLEGGLSPSFTKLGTADATREAGRTFQLSPQPQAGAFKLRGLVEFQWRRDSRLVASATRPTTAGHHSKVGAVPPGFSAATCALE